MSQARAPAGRPDLAGHAALGPPRYICAAVTDDGELYCGDGFPVVSAGADSLLAHL